MTPRRLENLIQRLDAHEIDLLIGTQMVAKGHHFPEIRFVGILDIDHALHHFDFRAPEHLFQQITQVAGRAGRGTQKGEVWLQTKEPEHPLITSLAHEDYAAWAPKALSERIHQGLPPFQKMVALILEGKSLENVRQTAQDLASKIPHHPQIEVLGPIPAPFPKINNRYRYRFLVMTLPQKSLSPLSAEPTSQSTPHMAIFIRHWLDKQSFSSSIRLHIDRDPYNFS